MQHARPTFRPLTVRAVEQVAEAAVAITFDVPDEWAAEFLEFSAGQHVTLSARIAGERVRQSYSITWSPERAQQEQALRIGVALVPGGRMSTWLNSQVVPGDVIDVLAPMGEFTYAPAPQIKRLHVAVAGGSGITPVLSIVTTALAAEPTSRFTVLYGTRSRAAAMFDAELSALAEQYAPRLRIIPVHSQEASEDVLLGRIEPDLLDALIDGIAPVADVDDWWLCGPEGLVDAVTGWLQRHRVPAQRVHHEVFHTVHHSA